MNPQKGAGSLRSRIRKHSSAKLLRRLLRPAWMGTLRRTQPLSPNFGRDRGKPVDRYYIEKFLDEHRGDIRGRVLEVKDADYTKRFGAEVTGSDVLDIDAMNPNATIVADLQNAASIADGQFDCFILTQTLGHIADPLAVLKEARRILRPKGTLLLTVPGLATRVSDHNEAPADYWRFTEDSVRLLAGQTFGDDNVSISCYGNVLAAVAGLMGMAMEELTIRQLETLDTRYPVVVAARAVNMPE